MLPKFRASARRASAAIAGIAAIGLVLTGCAAPSGGEGGGGEAGEPVYGGSLTFLEYQTPMTCFYAGGSGYYPVASLLNQVGDKLTIQDPDTWEIEPWLAESWEINDDATEYIFHLREGVTFSDGSPLDAEVVAQNFDHYGLGNAELGLPAQEFVQNYASSEVIDPLTVKFTFHSPTPDFLQATSVVGAAIMAKATIELPYEEQCQIENAIGSGPFTISVEVPEQEFLLTVREDYNWAPPGSEHQGRAYLDEIRVIVTPEDSVRIGALTAGQADLIRSVQPFDEATITNAGLVLHAPQLKGVNPSLNLRMDNPILSDIKVRQALVKGTDVSTIIDTIFTDNYPQATSVLSSLAPGYRDQSSKLTFDAAAAEALLEEAGWAVGSDGIRVKDGERLSLNTIVITSIPQSQATLELVAQQWKNIGVELNIQNVDLASVQELSKDPIGAGVYESVVARVDPVVLKSQYHSGYRDALLSSDAELDRLLDEVASIPDPEERLAKAGEIQDYIIDNAYAIPLFEEPQVFAHAANVHGVDFEPVGRILLYDAWKS